jgi:hypothetical protein
MQAVICILINTYLSTLNEFYVQNLLRRAYYVG